MTRDYLMKLLLAPSITGARAIFYMILAAAVPTFIRASVTGFVSDCELTVYLPFVFLAAVFLGWKQAVGTALVSGVLAQLVVMGPHHSYFASTCSFYSLSVYSLGSAFLIAAVHQLRRVVAWRLAQIGSKEGGIVFSLENGQAWASWYGRSLPVPLGPQGEVAEMMKDFLAQLEVGKRLTRVRG